MRYAIEDRINFCFENRNDNSTDIHGKITIPEVIYPIDQCVGGFGFPMWLTLFVALIFWSIRLIRVVRNTALNLEIRAFYQSALGVQDVSLIVVHGLSKKNKF